MRGDRPKRVLVLQAIGSGAGQVLEPARAVAERNGADGGAKRSCWRSRAELVAERSGAAGGAERSCWQSGAELLAERSGAAGGAERSAAFGLRLSHGRGVAMD